MGIYKNLQATRKRERVSLSRRLSHDRDQLIKNLLQLFKSNEAYRLNELVDILNHPVQPLK